MFDLNLREGNNEKHEYLAQVGFNGFELGAEGPFSGSNSSSYLVNYRYSTLEVLNKIGVDFGVVAMPKYQDLCFKTVFPVKSGKMSFFGLGGINSILSEDNKKSVLDRYTFGETMGVTGLTYMHRFNPGSMITTTVATSYTHDYANSDVMAGDTIRYKSHDNNRENKFMLHSEWFRKINSRDNITTGINFDILRFEMTDSVYQPALNSFIRRLDVSEQLMLYQSYLQWQHHFSTSFSTVAGLHQQATDLNDEIVAEPRLACKWSISGRHSVNAGAGLHSQMQQRKVYFAQTMTDTINRVYQQTNRRLKFSKSRHFVAGYNFLFAKDHRLKAEWYYQHLYDIPVKRIPSYVSLINYGGSFVFMDTDSLINDGIGYNYGMELTLEKFLSQNYYYLFTLSLFDSRYQASDKHWRNTMYNGLFVVNGLGGYEWVITSRYSLLTDLKATWAGGIRAVPIDLEQSVKTGDAKYLVDQVYEKQYPDYYRFDLRVALKMNMKNSSQQLAIDITNLTSRHNHFFEYYDNDRKEMVEVGQMGILPVLLYRIQF